MAEFAPIIQVVAWGTKLSLSLYDFAIQNHSATRDANRIAKSVSLFSLMLKQVGTLLREDVASPSPESYETVQDITLLAQHAFAAIDEVLASRPQPNDPDGSASSPPRKLDLVSKSKLHYLLAYVDALNSTLSVMLQAFYTVRVIAWSRSRQDRAPASAADAVANERSQLEVLVIEQQLLLLDVSEAHDEYRRSRDFAASPSNSVHSDHRDLATDQDRTPSPSTLEKYKDQSIKTADFPVNVTESSALVRSISSRFSNDILHRWTRLSHIERRLSAAEEYPGTLPKIQQGLQRRDSYQPRVESESEDEASPHLTQRDSEVTSPRPQGTPSFHQAGAMERNALPIPAAGIQNLRSSAPFSPGGTYACLSPSTAYLPAGASPARSLNSGYFPSSPRASLNAIGPNQGPAPEVRERATSNGLGIPWRLWQGSNRWDFVDDQVMNSNTQMPVEKAYAERNSWTEIMQTWVRREAIEEARYSFNQVQKEIPDGKRTRFETCFCIGKALTYTEIRGLVDRSVELFRQAQYDPRLNAELSDSKSSARSINSAESSRRDRTRKSHSDRPRGDFDSSTNDSDSDARPRARRTTSSSNFNNRRSGSRRKKEREKRTSGSHAFGTLAKYGGVAALLEGLPDILRGI
ncbi:uncharacterized protein BKCO1_3600024 [Diplodia corticola]|uniref:Uncharacterized protein n=1 Tax=Diplodia corticola TaxID=236234 RepID=A0A1J9RY72_9PEZI|nr:uncharacterized protein BKCO1_3600024 [Diplodia corticola]OJD32764.1 hypothetical protein BKCO1_3600024 [Diplodia corticola]